ncbi:hypothetical protein F2P81_021555 [Scophthalmus maximus]|uniref:Uncharacterized protein n=1 Tax=Scophthalmus maximus TaxID=52904 RepID=A0A6A4S3S6_SCOMX|nr:hypothetical protein F2P81_021555 [Scophthalmus maximus]
MQLTEYKYEYIDDIHIHREPRGRKSQRAAAEGQTRVPVFKVRQQQREIIKNDARPTPAAVTTYNNNNPAVWSTNRPAQIPRIRRNLRRFHCAKSSRSLSVSERCSSAALELCSSGALPLSRRTCPRSGCSAVGGHNEAVMGLFLLGGLPR